jgi:hypothetical protein
MAVVVMGELVALLNNYAPFMQNLLLTNGGLSLIGLIGFVWMHRRDHKRDSHKCIQDAVLTEIRDKLNRYVWRFEGEEAQVRRRIIDYLLTENEIFISRMLVDMREYIRANHDFSKDQVHYYNELYVSFMKYWKAERINRPLTLTLEQAMKFGRVIELTLPMVRSVLLEVVDIVMDESLNGRRETTIDSALLRGFNAFQNLFRMALENEFK